MMVEERRFIFRKAFIPHDDEKALATAANKGRFARITIVSLRPLDLEGFTMKLRSTGLIALDADIETVVSRFHKTVRNEISRTHRDPSLRFAISAGPTNEGYRLHAQ